MSDEPTRRQVLAHGARGAGLLALGGAATYLAVKAGRSGAWEIDCARCLNSRLGAVNVPACEKCSNSCVLALSAVRAVNDYARCGRCYICPAYFNVTSAVGKDGLPSEKLCPRDAILRKPIGDVDPKDPANNFYEYVIDETKCNGCGKCVMACKEPAGLGSIRLEVRHNLCLDCNRCSIAIACPDEAYVHKAGGPADSPKTHA